MKKEFKLMSIFIMLISMFLLTPNVYAEDIFSFDFKTEIKDFYMTYVERDDGLPRPQSVRTQMVHYQDNISKVISYKDGYLEVKIVDNGYKNGTELTYYSYTGEILKTNYFEDLYIVGITRDINPMNYLLINGDDIYCYAVEYRIIGTRVLPDIPTYTLKLNANLEIENRVEGYVPIDIKDNKLYAASKNSIAEFNLNLTNKNEVKLGNIENNAPYNKFMAQLVLGIYSGIKPSKASWLVEKVLDDIKNEDNPENSNNPFIKVFEDNALVDINDNYILLGDYNTEEVIVLDKNGTEVFRKKINEDSVWAVKLIHNYLGIIKNEEEKPSKIEIYDFKGNIVQTLKRENSNEFFADIVETEVGFSSFTIKRDYTDVSESIPYNKVQSRDLPTYRIRYLDIYEEGEYYNEFYTMAQPISLNIMGSGNVRVFASARFGQRVTFEVDTPEGQMLKKVEVFDSYKNSIEVENNSFIMPRTPVTINAEFVPVLKENPKTGLTTFTGFAILAVSLTIYFKKNKNKLTTLKKI